MVAFVGLYLQMQYSGQNHDVDRIWNYTANFNFGKVIKRESFL